MKLKFLIADEIRLEASGKQTVLGLYPDDVLVAHAPPKDAQIPEGVPPGIERLAFLINVSEAPAGKHTFDCRLFSPSGESYADIVPTQHEFEADGTRSHTIVLELKPFILKEGSGTYYWAITIGQEEFKLPFEVRIAPSP